MYIVPNTILETDELSHHGILGMKWGIRRFQPYKKGEKKGKEIDEAAKKKNKAKKIAAGVGISAAVAAGAAVTIASIKAGKDYKDFNRLFGPDNPVNFNKFYYGRGLNDRVKKNPAFRIFLSNIDKRFMYEAKTSIHL